MIPVTDSTTNLDEEEDFKTKGKRYQSINASESDMLGGQSAMTLLEG